MIWHFLQIHLPKLNPQLYSLEQAARGIGFYVNTIIIEFMRFKQEGAISILSGKPLKLVDQFTYLNSNISSTETDVNICQTKAWTAIDRLSIIWNLNSNRIKQVLFSSCGCVSTAVWVHHLDANKTHGKKARRKLHKNGTCCFKQILEPTLYKTAAVQPLTSHPTNYPMVMIIWFNGISNLVGYLMPNLLVYMCVYVW